VFGLSFSEIAIAGIVAFVLFGPEQFPVMVRQAIKWISEAKKYIYDAQNSLKDFTRDIEEEFNPIQGTVKSHIENLNSPQWTSPSTTDTKTQATGTHFDESQPVSLDKNAISYPQNYNWKKHIDIDRNIDHYP
jgi:Sec-independent protein translocase protein TatA